MNGDYGIIVLLLGLVVAALWCIALELRAIRKVHQARWNFKRFRRKVDLYRPNKAYHPETKQATFELLEQPHGLDEKFQKLFTPPEKG